MVTTFSRIFLLLFNDPFKMLFSCHDRPSLSKAAGGSSPTAIFNAVVGNVLGVFATPTIALFLV
jgi:hypothetical protein